jgi:hypothetical protein
VCVCVFKVSNKSTQLSLYLSVGIEGTILFTIVRMIILYPSLQLISFVVAVSFYGVKYIIVMIVMTVVVVSFYGVCCILVMIAITVVVVSFYGVCNILVIITLELNASYRSDNKLI